MDEIKIPSIKNCLTKNSLKQKSFFNWSGGKNSLLALYPALSNIEILDGLKVTAHIMQFRANGYDPLQGKIECKC